MNSMSQCTVPNWNLKHQRQEQVEAAEEKNRSSHVLQHNHLHQNQTTSTSHLVPMSNNDEVAELTWENGQLVMHGLGGLVPNTASAKPTWCRTGDTLESLVQRATISQKRHSNLLNHHCTNLVASPSQSQSQSQSYDQVPHFAKRTKSESKNLSCSSNGISSMRQLPMNTSARVSGSDTTMMTSTWANSFDSSYKTFNNETTFEDADTHGGLTENQDEDRETNVESAGLSNSTRRSRAAAVHNQSERRRRDRINQKMKALQKLVPNASKTDKASMLDEIIEYLKNLQAQVQLMTTMRSGSMPQMMMPLGMQQHLQMSLLARMGMGVGLGMGMGMLDMATIARAPTQSIPSLVHPSQVTATPPAFVPPPFMVPSMIPTNPSAQAKSEPSTSSSVPVPDPYCALLAQSMNMDLYNKMAVLYSQQANQTAQAASCPSRSSHLQDD